MSLLWHHQAACSVPEHLVKKSHKGRWVPIAKKVGPTAQKFGKPFITACWIHIDTTLIIWMPAWLKGCLNLITVAPRETLWCGRGPIVIPKQSSSDFSLLWVLQPLTQWASSLADVAIIRIGLMQGADLAPVWVLALLFDSSYFGRKCKLCFFFSGSYLQMDHLVQSYLQPHHVGQEMFSSN